MPIMVSNTDETIYITVTVPRKGNEEKSVKEILQEVINDVEKGKIRQENPYS